MPTRLQNQWRALLVLVLVLGSFLGVPTQQVTTAQDAESENFVQGEISESVSPLASLTGHGLPQGFPQGNWHLGGKRAGDHLERNIACQEPSTEWDGRSCGNLFAEGFSAMRDRDRKRRFALFFERMSCAFVSRCL